jgi:hypothetical protein
VRRRGPLADFFIVNPTAATPTIATLATPTSGGTRRSARARPEAQAGHRAGLSSRDEPVDASWPSMIVVSRRHASSMMTLYSARTKPGARP